LNPIAPAPAADDEELEELSDDELLLLPDVDEPPREGESPAPITAANSEDAELLTLS
jgi:hypothetical protein